MSPKPTPNAASYETVFTRLRAILEKHSTPFAVTADTNNRYCLEGVVGPATLAAWGGKAKRSQIPVAWVEVRKTGVSFHLMAADAIPRNAISVGLEKRMQGKTCFNFTSVDDALFRELDRATEQGLAAFRKAGFVA